jgi:hypothetical protein
MRSELRDMRASGARNYRQASCKYSAIRRRAGEETGRVLSLALFAPAR